jgi:hypothetical protein
MMANAERRLTQKASEGVDGSIESLAFRRLDPKALCRTVLVPAAKWGLFGIAVYCAAEFPTKLGMGQLGLLAPILILEARVHSKRHWKPRFMNHLAWFIPMHTLLIFVGAIPHFGCGGSHTPLQKLILIYEYEVEFLSENSWALAISFILLACLAPGRLRKSPCHHAFLMTLTIALLSIVTTCSVMGFTYYGFEWLVPEIREVRAHVLTAVGCHDAQKIRTHG